REPAAGRAGCWRRSPRRRCTTSTTPGGSRRRTSPSRTARRWRTISSPPGRRSRRPYGSDCASRHEARPPQPAGRCGARAVKVSVLGLGQMGAPIADRLIGARHDVAVWNRTASVAEAFAGRGATVLSRPVEAWRHGETAIVMLAHDAAVEAVLLGPSGLLTESGDGRTLVDMSTISVDGSARLAE